MAEVMKRLENQERVSAALLFGSSATGVSADSDFDLLVVLREHPCPTRFATTWIDRRVTDLIFLSSIELERLSDTTSWDGVNDDLRYSFKRHVEKGRIVFDKDGRLSTTQSILRSANPAQIISLSDIFRHWDHANYSLAQTRRYAQAGSALYEEAFWLRMNYQLAEAMLAYFAVRQMSWPGEKRALQHWQQSDPEMKRLFMTCTHEQERARKLELYEELLAHVLEPAGGLWPVGSVSRNPFMPENALLWEALIGGEGNG